MKVTKDDKPTFGDMYYHISSRLIGEQQIEFVVEGTAETITYVYNLTRVEYTEA